MTVRLLVVLLVAVTVLPSHIVGQAAKPAIFAPLEQWKAAVLSGNAATLQSFYSTNPPARIVTAKGESDAASAVAFWTGLKARRLKFDNLQTQSPQAGVQQVAFQAEIFSAASSPAHTLYVIEIQVWQQQGGQWRLAASQRREPTRLQQPVSVNNIIYTPGLDAHAEIKQALAEAAKDHKRVILVFGADWCYDCHVLDLAFHRPDVSAALRHSYIVVHIDVGEGDKNQDIMQQYQVPMKKGIPALAVLDSNGKLLYSQQGGEFEKARSLAPEDVLAFLNKWKPATP